MSSDNFVRLQKFLSSCGVASRRKSEELILSGAVTVDGVVADVLGVKVSGNEDIRVNGKVISQAKKKYIVINKPEGYICSRGDNFGRKTIFDLLGGDNDSSLFYAGRLDFNSCGLLVLTNDGEFANRLIHPSNNVVKRYFVTSSCNIPDKVISRFTGGVNVDGVFYKAVKCFKSGESNSVYIELNEGKKREIREVFKYFGIPVLRLERVAIGNMELALLDLKQGEYRFMTLSEMENFIGTPVKMS